LQRYLVEVDREVERQKGKLPFFSSNELKALLLRGDGKKLEWTKTANYEFKTMEFCTKV